MVIWCVLFFCFGLDIKIWAGSFLSPRAPESCKATNERGGYLLGFGDISRTRIEAEPPHLNRNFMSFCILSSFFMWSLGFSQALEFVEEPLGQTMSTPWPGFWIVDGWRDPRDPNQCGNRTQFFRDSEPQIHWSVLEAKTCPLDVFGIDFWPIANPCLLLMFTSLLFVDLGQRP